MEQAFACLERCVKQKSLQAWISHSWEVFLGWEC